MSSQTPDGAAAPPDPGDPAAELTPRAVDALAAIQAWVSASGPSETSASSGVTINDYGVDHRFSPKRFLVSANRADGVIAVCVATSRRSVFEVGGGMVGPALLSAAGAYYDGIRQRAAEAAERLKAAQEATS